MTLDSRPAGPIQTSTLSGRSLRVRRDAIFCFSAARVEGHEEKVRMVVLRGGAEVGGLVRGVGVGRAALWIGGSRERKARPAESSIGEAMKRLGVRHGIKVLIAPKLPLDECRSRDDGD